MALPHVADLIHQAVSRKGMTVAELERKDRTGRNYIQKWCDPKATLKLPPVHDTIYALGRILDLDPGDLYYAFLLDSSMIKDGIIELRTGLPSDQQQALDLYLSTPPEQRHMLLQLMAVFAGGFTPSPSPSPSPAPEDNRQPFAPFDPSPVTEPNHVAGESQSASARHPDALAS